MLGEQPRLEHTCKIILLGDENVGKSSLLASLLHLHSVSPTIGIDFRFLPMHPNRCIIWDSSGKELFRPIVRAYYKQTHIAIFVYDVTNRASFLNISSWNEFYSAENTPYYKILVAKKNDLGRRISTQQGQSLADQLGMCYFEDHQLNFQEFLAPKIDHVFHALSQKQNSLPQESPEEKKIQKSCLHSFIIYC